MALTHGQARLEEIKVELEFVKPRSDGIAEIRKAFGLTEGQHRPGPSPPVRSAAAAKDSLAATVSCWSPAPE